MAYKRIPDLAFAWEYEDLMKLPLFMIFHIYSILDEFIEEDKKKYSSMSTNFT